MIFSRRWTPLPSSKPPVYRAREHFQKGEKLLTHSTNQTEVLQALAHLVAAHTLMSHTWLGLDDGDDG